MLAEPKYKQKWAADPRNTQWSQDTSKFGYQMLSKMGWSEGKGLGANGSGMVSHVKVVKRNSNLGLGSKTDHSDNWIAHQDDFNALLAKLNQKKSDDDSNQTGEERSSLKSTVQQSRKKIFYSKFIHSKDLSMKSRNDLACVMGQRSKSMPSTPQDLSEDEGAKSDASIVSCPAEASHDKSGIVTTNSEMNLQQYFAKKMAALKNKKMDTSTKGIIEESSDVRDLATEGSNELKKKKKKSKKEKRGELIENSNFCDTVMDTECSREVEVHLDSDENPKKETLNKKKKSKKSKTKEDKERLESGDEGKPILTDNLIHVAEEDKKSLNKKSKKNKKHSNKEEMETEENSKIHSKKKRKDKKRRKEREDCNNEVSDEGLEFVVKKKKMRT